MYNSFYKLSQKCTTLKWVLEYKIIGAAAAAGGAAVGGAQGANAAGLGAAVIWSTSIRLVKILDEKIPQAGKFFWFSATFLTNCTFPIALDCWVFQL